MGKVECWHPSGELSICYNNKANDILKIICMKCKDEWTVIKDDRLLTYIEQCGSGYVQVRRDSSSAVTSRQYEPNEWELNGSAT